MSGRSVHVFVLIDALGWHCLASREFLSDVLPYRRPLRTILGFSSGAIPTLLTGRAPAETGHWNLYAYDPQGSPFRWLRHLRFLPDAVLDTRVSRKVVKELGRRMLGLGPLFECAVTPRLLPWFRWTETRNIYAPGGIDGGGSIFDVLAASAVRHRVYSYHDGNDGELLARARRDLRESDATFFFVYLSQFDGFLHAHRTSEDLVTDRLGWYATELRRLFAEAREADPHAGFTITSDHGMAAVRQHVDLVSDVRALGLEMPDDYLAVYDSTMARFWTFSSRARARIPELLGRLPSGRLLTEGDLRELGIWFPDGRYGEHIFLLPPGAIFARSDFNGAGWTPTGMHGYHPDDPESDAVYLSTRAPRVEPKTIADVYGCLCDAAQVVCDLPERTSR
jgi:hypothetical protein